MTLVDPRLFKKYDIRGIAQGDDAPLNPASAERIGLGIGTYFQRIHHIRQIVVGRDNRLTSGRLQDSLMRGLVRSGADVVDIGLVSTPLVYWHAVKAGDVGGVMVTGSHLAPHYNGFKISLGSANIYDHALQLVAKIVHEGNFSYGAGAVRVNQAAYRDYVQDVAGRISIGRRLKVVIDPANGTGGLFAPRLLELWGQDVIALNLQPDGNFPNHLPNPQEEANMRELGAKVREVGADVGIAFDGDADRIGVVDEQGRMISADRILALLARDMLSRHGGAAVVAEVLCSQVLFDAIAQAGGQPIMVASGHSIVKDAMREAGALLGGEMSGHIFMGEDYWGFDDGYFVMGRVLALLAQSGQALSALDDSLPRLYSTPEYRPHCPEEDKDFVIQGVANQLKGKGDISTIDGVRLTVDGAWGILRASNTEPVLSLRFEGASEEATDKLKAMFTYALAQYPQVEKFG